MKPASEENAPALPHVRAITRGPKFHWFGYYDKLQFDPSMRYVLSNEVDFEHRSLYEVLESDYGRVVTEAQETLEPVILTPRECELLEVPQQLPF